LLLSLAVLFLFFTPGEYLSGFAGQMGITADGLSQAGLQVGRLLILLISLALVHEYLGTKGLLVGFYWLLRPFAGRERAVVRLMLILEQVEGLRAPQTVSIFSQRFAWSEWLKAEPEGEVANETVWLEVPAMTGYDRLLLALFAVLALAWMFA
jgi:hypothetical protein